MASIIKRRNNWYARVKWYPSGMKWQKMKEIPLRTKSKVTARERLAEVNPAFPMITPQINSGQLSEACRVPLSVGPADRVE